MSKNNRYNYCESFKCLPEEKMAELKKTCFVITPVGNEEDPILRHIEGIINAVLIPVLGDDYEIIISHKLPDTGSVHKQIIQYIYDADLVVANLTKKHPVVIYELAFRHSIGTPVIMIAEQGTNLPYFFTEKTIYYINDAQGVLELIEKLMTQVDFIDFSRDREGPIYDALLDTSKEEYLVKKIEKEYHSLADMDKNDEIAEINEMEYAFFRDLISEDSKKPATNNKPEYENYIPKEDINKTPESITLEQISNSGINEKENEYSGRNIYNPDDQSGLPPEKAKETGLTKSSSQNVFSGIEKHTFDEPEFEFLNNIMDSDDLPERIDADFKFIREILKDNKEEKKAAPEIDTLQEIFKEERPGKKTDKDPLDQVADIMDKLEKIEKKISNVLIFSEEHFKDLLDQNEYLNKLINFNNLYNEINGMKVQNKKSGLL